GPTRSRLWLIDNWPCLRVMVWPWSCFANWIVPPLRAAARTARSVPAEPSSAALVTVSVLSTVRSSRASSRGRKRGRKGRGRDRRFRSRLECHFSCRNREGNNIARVSKSGRPALELSQRGCRRADQAPGPCQAGEGVAWRQSLTGRPYFTHLV